MPVSSPSYFPPNRANGSIVGITAGTGLTGSRDFVGGKSAGNYLATPDIIVLGDSALSSGTLAAPLNDANAQYSVIVGSQTGKKLATWSGTQNGPCVMLGGDTWTAHNVGAGLILIGCGIFPLTTPPAGAGTGNATGNSVVIGNGIGKNTPAGSYSTKGDVIIGANALQNLSDATFGGSEQNVIIGAAAVQNTVGPSAAGFIGNVVVGSAAGLVLKTPNNVILGVNAASTYTGPGGNGNGVVCIGANSGLNSGSRNLVVIGGGANASAGEYQVIIGSLQSSAGARNTLIGDGAITVFNWGTVSGARNIYLGSNVGFQNPLASNDNFLVETYDGATRRTVLYGNLAAGNLMVGTSVPGTNRDFGGTTSTNILKLLNGTIGNANPIGGGYFYVNAGALHWVGSSGTDTTLASA